MARSRYAGSKIIDNNHYGTWKPPSVDTLGPDILDNVICVEHTLILGDRLDTLASKYYGDSELWWVVALANRIQDPFSISPGMRLRIPLDAKSILDKVPR